MVRSAALIALAGLAAGCSSGVARFDDGFYTGAVPQAGLTQTAAAQPYPGGVDQLNTGGIDRGAPNYGNNAGAGVQSAASTYPASTTYGGASTAPVQSHTLPPPPAPNYATPPAAATAAASDNASATRGAPPSTLQEQATRISTPQQRPANEPRAAAQSSGGSVTVGSGDTLAAIARRTGTSVAALKQANGLSGDSIRIGQSLTVPGAAAAPTQVASNQSAPATEQTPPAASSTSPASTPVAYTPPATAEKSSRPSTEQAAAPAAPTAPTAPTSTVAEEVEQEVAAVAPSSTGISQFRWPVQGRVVNRFGERVGSRRNDGLNISVPRGTSVKAAENGVVIYAGDGLKEFGNTVLVKHDSGLVTVYGHADSISVQRGATVKRGQEVAKSGMSGDTDVPVLHFEVRKDSTPVDPTKFLQ